MLRAAAASQVLVFLQNVILTWGKPPAMPATTRTILPLPAACVAEEPGLELSFMLGYWHITNTANIAHHLCKAAHIT